MTPGEIVIGLSSFSFGVLCTMFLLRKQARVLSRKEAYLNRMTAEIEPALGAAWLVKMQKRVRGEL